MASRGRGEGTIFKRKDGRWAAAVQLPDGDTGKRERKYVYARTRREAAQKLDAIRRALADGLPLPDERERLGPWLETWLRDVIDTSSLAPNTKAFYGFIVKRYLVPRLGHLHLARLRPQHVQRLVNEIAASLSPRTAAACLQCLRRALKKAQEWGLVQRNVATLVTASRPAPPIETVHAIPLDQIIRLLDRAKEHRLYALFQLMAFLGLRRGEALGLRWSDVDLDEGTLRVEQQVLWVPGIGLLVGPPKTEASRREIALPGECVEVLRAHRDRQKWELRRAGDKWEDHDLVFASEIGTPINPRNLTRVFHALCDSVGLPHERLHNFRHAAASIAFDAGLEIKQVTEMLGHANPGVTRHMYLHLTNRMRREGVEKIAEAFSEARGRMAVNDGCQAAIEGVAEGA